MEAAINALTGGTDYSNGAIRWDGYDLAARGFNHPKAKGMGVEVSQEHLDAFRAAWPDATIKAFSGGDYTSFSTNFKAGIHLANSGSNKGRALYESSAVHGKTMFWGVNKTAFVKDYSKAYWVSPKPIFNFLPAPADRFVVPLINVNDGYENWKGL